MTTLAPLAGRAVLVSALTVTLLPMLGASPASACSCAGHPGDQAAQDRRHFDKADVVFKGKFLRVEQAPLPSKNGSKPTAVSSDYGTLVFQASRVYKGTVRNPQRLAGDPGCGEDFPEQGPYLVFARKLSAKERTHPAFAGATYVLSGCGGTRPLEANEKVPFGPGKAVKRGM